VAGVVLIRTFNLYILLVCYSGWLVLVSSNLKPTYLFFAGPRFSHGMLEELKLSEEQTNMMQDPKEN
jgi:hypothetical protein